MPINTVDSTDAGLAPELLENGDVEGLYRFALGLREQADWLIGQMKACYPVLGFLPEQKIELIQKLVAAYFKKPEGVMASQVRTADCAWCRQVGMFFCREFTDVSLEQIGAAFGNRNHATILHGIGSVKDEMDTVPGTKVQIDFLRTRIRCALNGRVAA